MTRFTPRLEILPPAQRAIWPELQPTRELGLVLYGGTAIALRLGHRQSVDFDFFTSRPLDKRILRKALPLLADSTVIQDERDSLTVIANQVKLSFFGGLAFGRYGQPEPTTDYVLDVASLDDLMALKIKVLFQRSESKDYLDIAAMIQAGISLEKGLAIAEQMFRPELSPLIALKALTYFEGGDLESLPGECKKVLVDAVKNLGDLPVLGVSSFAPITPGY